MIPFKIAKDVHTSLNKIQTKEIKTQKFILSVLVLAIIIVGIVIFFKQTPKSKASIDNRTSVSEAKAKFSINKDFDFPVKDENGKEITKIRYSVTDAELRDEIVVQGKKATALKGRIFLILNLKITNSFDKSIDIQTRNYMRLSLNGNKTELLAPDIHNDPVSVQPISTKLTRLGFPIKDADTNLVLSIGEVAGIKEEIALQFK